MHSEKSSVKEAELDREGVSGRGREVNSLDEGRKNKFMKRHLFIMRRANGKSVWRVYRFTRFYDLELKREREREGTQRVER